jgi:hypothetical protein
VAGLRPAIDDLHTNVTRTGRERRGQAVHSAASGVNDLAAVARAPAGIRQELTNSRRLLQAAINRFQGQSRLLRVQRSCSSP